MCFSSLSFFLASALLRALFSNWLLYYIVYMLPHWFVGQPPIAYAYIKRNEKYLRTMLHFSGHYVFFVKWRHACIKLERQTFESFSNRWFSLFSDGVNLINLPIWISANFFSTRIYNPEMFKWWTKVNWASFVACSLSLNNR